MLSLMVISPPASWQIAIIPATLPSPIHTDNKRRLIMLYCEIFNVSHTLGDRTSSSITDIVLR
ncbi:hypothetical protein FBBNIHIM_23310 [Pseudocitrobacter vendiensis]|uniref:Uncharacterized protein n=1 Tax=Pseudocitrobacter vendiensis TaxID=2488306 RepID=A0ABN8TK02_9ENTR|nr:hypothetical protein FBBNIHIM_23310 [Pseudocitrobacter vendiensis]